MTKKSEEQTKSHQNINEIHKMFFRLSFFWAFYMFRNIIFPARNVDSKVRHDEDLNKLIWGMKNETCGLKALE